MVLYKYMIVITIIINYY